MERTKSAMGSRNIVFGGIFVVLGLLLVLTPRVFFPVCEYKEMRVTLANGKEVPMKCFWTARAELGLAILLVITGVLLAVFSNRGDGRVLAAMALAIGVIVLLAPTVLIGTCMNPQMPCNVGTKPMLVCLGVMTVLSGGLGVFMLKPKG